MALETDSPHTSTAVARSPRLRWVVGGALALVIAIVAYFVFGGGSGAPSTDPAAPEAARNAVSGVDPVTAALPESTTYTTIDGAPIDATPENATDGLVVHPKRETPVHDAPDGRPFARLPKDQFGATWLPVIGQQPGWVQVLLPSKPNGSTGWIRSADVDDATTPYVVNVHLRSKDLQLVKDGKLIETWKAGTGKASAPTPTGRTFLLGAFTDPKQTFSPVILPLGAHSPTHDSFGGGPGTVAIHTWPSAEVFGTASSDGCIRIPKDALETLTEVPIGTLVMITDD